jgi:hypothetical protein
MFQSGSDVKKFKDILVSMMNTQGSRLKFNSNEMDGDLEDTNTFGRRINKRNLDAATEEYKQVPDT